MTQSGWMDPLPDNHCTKPPNQLRFNEEHSNTDWKEILQEKRQEILDARDAEASKKTMNMPGQSVNGEPNTVKIIDKQYFMNKNFRAQNAQAQLLIDETVSKFSLNEAQERAFRIVANHAIQQTNDHL